VLNEIFAAAPVTGNAPASSAAAANSPAKSIDIIDIKEVGSHLSETVTIQSKVYSARDMGSMVLVNLGAAYPNQLLTVVLREGAKDKGKDLEGKDISVTGKLIEYKGKPEIVVTDAASLVVN
jgi:hypothetical protein